MTWAKDRFITICVPKENLNENVEMLDVSKYSNGETLEKWIATYPNRLKKKKTVQMQQKFRKFMHEPRNVFVV